MTLTRYRFIFYGPAVRAPKVEQFTVRKMDKGKVWIEDPSIGISQRTFHNHVPGYETAEQAWNAAHLEVELAHEKARRDYEATMDLLADWTSVVAGRFEKEAS